MACCLYWFLENRPVSAFIIHVDKRNNTERSPLIYFPRNNRILSNKTTVRFFLACGWSKVRSIW